jgi:hypothetical protein
MTRPNPPVRSACTPEMVSSYHDGLLRERPEHAGGFFIGLGGGLAGELLLRGNVAVYSNLKEVLNSGRL